MSTEIKTIRIDSILGGHAPTAYFAGSSQFLTSLGIDPALPASDSGSLSGLASGLLRPSGVSNVSSVGNAPMWIVNNPKFDVVYVYDASGSLYRYSANDLGNTFSAISDAGSLSGSSGNGAAYYDNFLYLSKNTTIARYGPLDNSVTRFVDGNYWAGTLGLTALSDTSYPSPRFEAPIFELPNHVLHRHSDGRLYIADVTGNQGQIHYIKTTKTTYEGDTNNGSTYGALTFGYGLWPTTLESYGSDLVIALVEGIGSGISTMNPIQPRAKLAFWDTTSANFNKIIWVEFPDPIITAMKNIDGVLYVASGKIGGNGFRVSRFVGGYTFEEVYYSEYGVPPLAGAMDGSAKRLLFGSLSSIPAAAGCVYSLGLQKSGLSDGLFNIMRSSNTSASQDSVTAVALSIGRATGSPNSFAYDQPFFGWGIGVSGTSNNGFNRPNAVYGTTASLWWSQMYRVGSTFKIKRIRIPFSQAMAANMTLDVKIYTDDASSSYTGASYGLPTLNNTTLPNSNRFANLNVTGVEGFNNFFVELKWSGSELLTVGLPIEIDVEIIREQ